MVRDDALLAVGTRKGLVLARRRGGRWAADEPLLFPLESVYAVLLDQRHDPPRLLVATDSEHWGPALHRSDDLGRTWEQMPERPIAFGTEDAAAGPTGAAGMGGAGEPAVTRRVWQLAAGGDAAPDVVYAGVEPTSLFRSEDGGTSFTLVEGLWRHPHRAEWGPGYGGAAIHTVLPDPRDPSRVTVAMSTGGVYRSADGGDTWQARNVGVQTTFQPERFPEYGQCVHKVAAHPGAPERLFLQNHHGVYRSDNGGDSWTSIAEGLPADFGFPIVIDADRPETVYVFPLKADAHRFTPDYRCRVYRSDDAGDTWRSVDTGLPDDPFYSIVLRDAMCAGQRRSGEDTSTPAGVYFGTRTGEVYASDEGERWSRVAEHLPDVLCVRAVTLN